jgi:GntR family transcriptional repressor for pyruvate dehydrogenase complex
MIEAYDRSRKARVASLLEAEALRDIESGGVGKSVVDRILSLVQSGMLRPGDRLPSERDLIEIFSISRPSLREALRALSILGVIESRHGGGAFVTDLEPRTLLAPLDFFLSLREANLSDAFASRRVIETDITRRAALAARDEDVLVLRAMIAAHDSIQNDPVGFRILDSRFHEMIWNIAGNAVMQRFALALYSMGLDVRRRATQDPALIRQSTQDHIRIVAAIADRDGERAFAEMLLHLDHIEETTRTAMLNSKG